MYLHSHLHLSISVDFCYIEVNNLNSGVYFDIPLEIYLRTIGHKQIDKRMITIASAMQIIIKKIVMINSRKKVSINASDLEPIIIESNKSTGSGNTYVEI